MLLKIWKFNVVCFEFKFIPKKSMPGEHFNIHMWIYDILSLLSSHRLRQKLVEAAAMTNVSVRNRFDRFWPHSLICEGNDESWDIKTIYRIMKDSEISLEMDGGLIGKKKRKISTKFEDQEKAVIEWVKRQLLRWNRSNYSKSGIQACPEV